MPRSIVLSVSGVDRTLTLDSQRDGKTIYTEKTGPLVGRLRLTAKVAPNTAGSVLRSNMKVEQRKVVDATTPLGVVPVVQWTQVWSHDVSVVTTSSDADRDALYDLNIAVLANANVREMVVDGVSLDS